MSEVQLGAEYADRVSGFRGVATGKATYLTGCDQICLIAKSKAGAEPTVLWVDITRLARVKGAKVVEIKTSKAKGGPQAVPTREDRM